MAPNLGFFCPAGVDVVHAFVRRGIPREDEVLDYSYAYVRNIAYLNVTESTEELAADLPF